MERLILSQSPDGILEDMETIREDAVAMNISFPFLHAQHFEHFQDVISRGHAEFDLRSRIAQLGFDFRPTSKLTPDHKDKSISLEGIFFLD